VVADQLEHARLTWEARRDRSRLRRALLAILTLLDE
jgi:hypothetical protein